MKKTRIFIATGIYPPDIGGPSEYASNLSHIWKVQGFDISVGVFRKWNFLPTGLRHLAYMIAIFPKVFRANYILILDTYSAALPTVFLGKVFGKKMVVRTGGDFLWEAYVERTGDLVLLRDFYVTRLNNLSGKEKLIFKLTEYVLKSVSVIAWTTEWQKEIFIGPYGLQKQTHIIIENYFGPKQSSVIPADKNFVGAARNLKWKNIDFLKSIFENSDIRNSGAVLDLKKYPHDAFKQHIAESYAVIIASLGDISPNTIIDAITYGVPFIVTKETGLYDRIKDVALFVNPKSKDDIAEKILWLCNMNNYEAQKKKIESWSFIHDWDMIAGEFEDIFLNTK